MGSNLNMGPQFLDGIRLLKSTKILTVGSGGNYSTINAALTALSSRYPEYVSGGYTAEVSLLTGFEMAEQVIVDGIDLSWITITSVDAEVIITRSALVTVVQSRYPAFYASRGKLPKIDVLFNMDASGTATDRDGILLYQNGDVFMPAGAGIKNAGGHGIFLNRKSESTIEGCNFSGAGIDGISMANYSHAFARNADCSTVSGTGLNISNGCTVEASGLTGSLSQAANTLTSSGIIYQ